MGPVHPSIGGPFASLGYMAALSGSRKSFDTPAGNPLLPSPAGVAALQAAAARLPGAASYLSPPGLLPGSPYLNQRHPLLPNLHPALSQYNPAAAASFHSILAGLARPKPEPGLPDYQAILSSLNVPVPPITAAPGASSPTSVSNSPPRTLSSDEKDSRTEEGPQKKTEESIAALRSKAREHEESLKN